jgi:hypothetical protein
LKKLLFIGLVFVASGCATGSKQNTCADRDWNHYGEIDALNGRLADYWKKHKRQCVGESLKVDVSSYSQGWEKGRQQFCQERERAFYHGQLGLPYQGQCEGLPSAREFSRHYRMGRRVYRLRRQKSRLQAQRKEWENSHLEKAADKSVTDASLGVANNNSPQEQEWAQKEKDLQRKIDHLSSRVPALSLSRESSSPGPSSQDVAGAFAGTVVGFGLGHALQNRYWEKGWIFTAGESAALGGLLYANSQCQDEPTRVKVGGGSRTERECDRVLPLLSLLTFVGLRVWQASDLFGHVSLKSQQAWQDPSPSGRKWLLGVVPGDEQLPASLALTVDW